MVSSLGVPRPQRVMVPSTQKPDVVAAPSNEEAQGEHSWMDGDDVEELYDEEDESSREPSALLNNPEGICLDKSGSIFVTDTIRSCVRRITPQGKVLRFAGTDTPGYKDGILSEASFRHPRGICVLSPSQSGNNHNHSGCDTVLVVCDTENHCVRIIREGSGSVTTVADSVTTVAGSVTTVAGSAAQQGYKDGPAREALFNMPWAVCALDDGASVLVCDYSNHCIRKVTVRNEDGDAADQVVSTVYGTPETSGEACEQLWCPWSICQTSQGIVVGDKMNQRVILFDLEQRTPSMILSSLWPDSVRFAPRGLASDGTSLYMTDAWQSQIWCVQRDADSDSRQLSALRKIAGAVLVDVNVRESVYIVCLRTLRCIARHFHSHARL
jgi:hypothetical protein